MKKYFLLANPLYWPIWLGLGLLWCIVQLPPAWRLTLGRWLGKLLYCFPSKLKQITFVNLKLCFPNLSKLEQEQLARANFTSLGLGIVEAGMAWWLPQDKLPQLFQIHGLEHLEKAFARGKGVILLSPHFTSLELIGRLLSTHHTFAVMYRPHKKPFINFIHSHFRKKYLPRTIARHRMRELLRTLQENIAVWYAYDVDGGRKRSVFAPFFGLQTASLTSVSRLVQLSDAAVVPICFYRRENEFHYDIFLQQALENFPTGDLQQDATQLNAALEYAIKQSPAQYVWQYKRFKTRPPGEARFY